MAEHLSEITFATKCNELFKKGSKWFDDNLFNGQYYNQIVKPIPQRNIDPIFVSQIVQQHINFTIPISCHIILYHVISCIGFKLL